MIDPSRPDAVNDPELDPIFRDLFERFYQWVFGKFRRWGFSREDAEDLAQDTFVRVYEYRTGYRRQAESSWLAAIAKTVKSNELRSRAAVKRSGAEVTRARDFTPDSGVLELMGWRAPDSPEQITLETESWRLIEQAIEELPADSQRFIKMWLEGWKYREIATAQQVSLDVVKSRVSRAKKQMKTKIDRAGRQWLEAKEQDHA